MVWQILGVEKTRNKIEIKRAYAQQLRTKRPNEDALEFQLLKSAYEFALL